MLDEGAGIADVAGDRRRHRFPRRRSWRAASSVRLVGGAAARPGRAARRRAADHGRRRAAADVPEGRARAAAPAAADRPPAGARRPGRRSRRMAFSRVALRADAPLRHRDDRAPQTRSRPSPRTICGRSTLAAFRPDNAPLIVVGDVTRRPACCRSSSRSFGALEGRRARPSRASVLPAPSAAGTARDLPRRQAGRAAVADPHRWIGVPRVDARLLSHSGDEYRCSAGRSPRG